MPEHCKLYNGHFFLKRIGACINHLKAVYREICLALDLFRLIQGAKDNPGGFCFTHYKMLKKCEYFCTIKWILQGFHPIWFFSLVLNT